MASDPGGRGRVIGVWGARAYASTGEETTRAAGFPIDVSGRTRVLGFPAWPSAAGEPGTPHRGAPRSEERARLVVAVFAILGGRSATSRTPAPERARAPSGRMP
jgi:hypothetical protein